MARALLLCLLYGTSVVAETVAWNDFPEWLRARGQGHLVVLRDGSQRFVLIFDGVVYDVQANPVARRDGWYYGWTVLRSDLSYLRGVHFSHARVEGRAGYLEDVVGDVDGFRRSVLPGTEQRRLDQVWVPIEKFYSRASWRELFRLQVPPAFRSAAAKVDFAAAALGASTFALYGVTWAIAPSAVVAVHPMEIVAGGLIYGCMRALVALLEPRFVDFRPGD